MAHGTVEVLTQSMLTIMCIEANVDWLCRNRDLAWQEIHSVVREGSLDARQVVYCLTILFAYNLCQYNTAMNPSK